MSNVINSDKVLFLITGNYPFSKNEAFIETEIIYLSKKFKKIIIISHDVTSFYRRKTPINVETHRISYNPKFLTKFLSFLVLFDKDFWDELLYIKSVYNRKISCGILKTLLLSIYNSRRLSKIYIKISQKYNDNNLVFYSYWSNDSAIALALIKLKNSHFKCISRIHGWDVFFEPSKYSYLPLRNLLANNLDSIYSISKAGIDYCINYWNIKEFSNLKLSRLGVTKGKFSKNIADQFTIVSCSNIISIKRINLLIESLSKLNIKINWVHFGDGEKMGDVLALSKEILPNNINYEFKGRVKNIDVLNYYRHQSPSLFVNLSSTEGLPVSIMEAMSFGIPVIATNVGGTSEIVNNKNGYLINANPSSKEVANMIFEYYNLKNEIKLFKKNEAFCTWENKFNANKNYNQFAEEIISL